MDKPKINKKMSTRPPIVNQKVVSDFINEAETKLGFVKKDIIKPWEAPGVREDVVKAFNLRLSEVYLMKIQYLSEVTHKSQQSILREIICNEIDKILKEI